MHRIILLAFLLSAAFAVAQDTQPPATRAEARSERHQAFLKSQSAPERNILAGLTFRNIGPTVMSGRVSDIAVHPDDPTVFYVAYASGGLWKTENNGASFRPLFDDEMVMTIGDIAVDWENEVIWVGTGEVNSSRSSYAGTGVYVSKDEGASWQWAGLPESHHIGRILIDPTDPQTVYAAVLGHLYSPNPERGVYKTTDGGQNWERVLYVNDNAGAADLVFHPDNPQVLYAATWERTRRAWNFVESGEGSAIHRSEDGGKTWTNLTAGFPNDEGAGRIGLAITKDGDQTVLYASIDNYNRRPKEEAEADQLTKDALRSMDKAGFLNLEKYLVKDYLRRNGFPEKYDYDKVRNMIEAEQIQPADLAAYTEDANALLFDTPVIGLELYRSEDEGRSWTKTHDDYIDRVYNSYGYYFGQVRVSPHDPNRVYLLGVPIIRSDDGGKSFFGINDAHVHGDHHALWSNPDREGHLILGNDGGLNISYDDGETWIKCNTPAVGQFYAINVDMAKPYRVYGGLQDNGVWMGPSNYEFSYDWYASGHYPYRSIMGGDGMQVEIDTRDNTTVYTGFQFGNYYRINTQTEKRQYITPRHDLGERPLRWNWQSPIHLSRHNQDILYMGSHKLHRSLNQGDDWATLSEDLTKGGRKGDVPYGTLTTIHESPLQFGMIYTGSDDGKVHLTRDGGFSWTDISSGLPADMWVSRVQASAHEKGRVYVSLNGYRWDDFSPYLYVSENFGENWRAIGRDLPPEPINVVREDPENPELLYVGTDRSVYISLDRGQSFLPAGNSLPAVPVHDLVVHARDKDLVVGTHGRSIYVADIEQLQQFDEALLAETLHLFDIDPVRHSSRWGADSWWRSTEPEPARIPVYAAQAGKAQVAVKTSDGLQLHGFTVDCRPGLNYLEYDLTLTEKAAGAYEKALNKERKEDERPVKVEPADNGKRYLQPGDYTVEVSLNGTKEETELKVK